MTADPPWSRPLVAKSYIPLASFCDSLKALFIKKEEFTEEQIVGARFVITENGLADGFIRLEINEVISLKINFAHLWMTTNKLARFLPFR